MAGSSGPGWEIQKSKLADNPTGLRAPVPPAPAWVEPPALAVLIDRHHALLDGEKRTALLCTSSSLPSTGTAWGHPRAICCRRQPDETGPRKIKRSVPLALPSAVEGSPGQGF